MAERESQITFRSDNIDSEQLVEKLQNRESDIVPPKEKQRLSSLDILRGLTILGMMIVDLRGPHAPWWIKHGAWDGLSPADFIFPSFVFIMGMAVPLAITKTKPLSIRTLFRIIGLFVIGMFLGLMAVKFNFNQFRILGVLQRLSVCYLLVIIIHVITKYGDPAYRVIGGIIAACFGLVYLALMLSFQKVEIGCFKSNNLTPFCNFGSYIDRQIFGQHHMIYPNDPEGLFTNLSAFLNGYIGYVFTLIMLDNKQNVNKTLFIWGIFSLILGSVVYPLTFLMPFNKKIWSISFVFLTSAASGVALIVITYLCDILPNKKAGYSRICKVITQPMIWLGRNPLAIFVMMMVYSIILSDYIIIDDKSAYYWIYYYLFQIWIRNQQVASVFLPVFYAILWTLVAGLMFKFNIFIKL